MMNQPFLLTASLTLCWALSPDVLVLLGNSFGQHGQAFAFVLLAGAVVSAAAAHIIHHPALAPAGDDQRILITQPAQFPAVTFSLAGRLSPPLLFSTGMLVTAGFTFNETFVYWFPNFGFSFLLLALVVVVHICGDRAVLVAQRVFFGLTASCLLFLVLAGLMTEPTLPQSTGPAVPGDTKQTFLSLVPLTPLAMLVFLGYDQQVVRDGGTSRYFPLAVGLGCVLLAFWGLASLQHVPQARLAESSVPYVVGAKAILGQPGRLIMGIAIISGACGAVNGLFYLAVGTVRRIVTGSSSRNPTRPGPYSWLPKIQAVLMALVIALFMAVGLAGSENLEVYIFGALLLWLLANGVDCLAAAAHLQQQRKKYSSLGYAMGGLILAAVAYLAFTYPQPRLLVFFCGSVLIASGLFSATWCRFRPGAQTRNHQHKGDII